MAGSDSGDPYFLRREDLQALLDTLVRRRYRVIGPTIRDGAIGLDRIRRVQDLPVGWTDQQDGGTYRLRKRDDDAVFGYVVGQHSWKNLLFPHIARLWTAGRRGKRFRVQSEEEPGGRTAFLGVRSCDLYAIRIQDQILTAGEYGDPGYRVRRESALLIVVNCVEPHGTCFCASMGTGPRARAGFDLALTEICRGDEHYFVVESGTKRGSELLAKLPCRKARREEIEAADQALAGAASAMGRTLDTRDIKNLLYSNYEHPRWDEVVKRCLLCGNCTMVCPTCFCSTVVDVTDITGREAQRERRLDSCFTLDFSYVHGGSVRSSPRSRYRQWMVHKLAAWIDQFGMSGCVGCGRCITWCPVGIDITEEARAIRETALPCGGPAKE